MILSGHLHKKSQFQHGIEPFFFSFHRQRPGTFVTQPKQTMKLRKHRAHAPLLLAEKLGKGAINKRSTLKVGRCRKICVL